MKSKQILKNMAPYKQGMQIEEVKKQYGLQRIVKLASNENPYGCSDRVNNFLGEFTHYLEFYPDGYSAVLRTALATKLHIDEEQLVFGSGSDEIVQIICRTFLYTGVNTIMAASTFPQYKHNALIEGASVKEIPTMDGYHDLGGMLNAIDENTAVIWICSPDNPTGTLISRESFTNFMEKCPSDILVVLDEAYYEYMDPELDIGAVKLLDKYKNLVILRTFSKAYGLAGLRIGYGMTNKTIANKLNVVRSPFNTTSIAQGAALMALKDESFLQQTVLQNKTVKQTFEQFLDHIGWDFYDSHTNFLLVSTPTSGNEVFQYLLENGFIIRPGELLGYPNTIRVTIGKAQDMEKLQDLLNTFNQKTNKGIQ